MIGIAEAINKIFVEAFGVDVYDENLEQCALVAGKIMLQYRKGYEENA